MLAAACIGVLGWCVHWLAAPGVRCRALLLTVANPLVLLQLLGAAHWEALIAALLAVALLLWRRRSPLGALVVASAAAAVKCPVAVAAVALAVLHVHGLRDGRAVRVATATAAAVLPWLLLALVVPDSIGFRHGLGAPVAVRSRLAPASLAADLITPGLRLLQAPVTTGGVLTACRLFGMVAAAAGCAALWRTCARRPADQTVGLSLLAVGLLGPVLYPWYVTWGLLPLAWAVPRAHRLVAAASIAALLTAVPGLGPLEHRIGHGVPAVTVALAVGAALGGAWRGICRWRRRPQPAQDLVLPVEC